LQEVFNVFILGRILMDARTKILTEAGRLFYKMGIRSVTMDYLADQLGISKRTIYENFRDKDEIVLHSLVNGFNQYTSEISMIVSEAPNVLEGIYNVGKKNHEVFSRINDVFMHDLRKYHSDVYDLLMKKGGSSSSDMNLKLMKRGINEGIFKKEINIELVNVLLDHLMSWSHSDNNNIFMRFSKDDIHNSIIKPFLIGICTTKGLVLLKQLDNIPDE